MSGMLAATWKALDLDIRVSLFSFAWVKFHSFLPTANSAGCFTTYYCKANNGIRLEASLTLGSKILRTIHAISAVRSFLQHVH